MSISNWFCCEISIDICCLFDMQNKSVLLEEEKVFIWERKKKDDCFVCLFRVQEEFYTIFISNVNPKIQ